MPFPSLIMGLITKTKLQIFEWPHCGSEGLSHWCTHSHQEHSPHQRFQDNVHTIPQDRITDEGEDTKEEIDRFTSTTEPLAQPSSSAPAQGPDRLNRLLDRVEQMYTMLDSVLALWPFRLKRGRKF